MLHSFYSGAILKYVTALYFPDGYGIGNTPSNRFARRALSWKLLEKGVPEAITRLKISQEVLGNDMVVFLDPRMGGNDRTKDIYSMVAKSKLNIKDVYEPLPRYGFWLKKWHIALQALNHIGDFIWMDFMDTVVKEKLSDQEIEFLRSKEICVEWEVFRNFGEPLHYSNGKKAGNRVKQPQTSIYYLSSVEIPKMALETKIDHDQISLAHVFEKKYGIFQDVGREKLLEFSSRGLFKTLPDDQMNKLLNNDHLYKTKIFHKCGF